MARTSNDLTRYHDKYILIDRRVLYVLSFNFTHLDIDHSRGFGIETTRADLGPRGRQALPSRLHEVEVHAEDRNVRRQPGERPEGTRHVPEESQDATADLRPQRSRTRACFGYWTGGEGGRRDQGHRLGDWTRPTRGARLTAHRLHTRTIIRDRGQAFVGSQSLRAAELDLRRELGLIVQDAKAVNTLIETFESDWASAPPRRRRPVARPGRSHGRSGGRHSEGRREGRPGPHEGTGSARRQRDEGREEGGGQGRRRRACQRDVKDTMKKVVKER